MASSNPTKGEMTAVFAHELRAARLRAGMSQEHLAAATGLRWSSISSLERAKRTPRLDTICRLAHGLGLTPSELVNGLGKCDHHAGGDHA